MMGCVSRERWQQGWREIHAAVALTNLTRAEQGGASRIIQKSSHISEVQTVGVGLAGANHGATGSTSTAEGLRGPAHIY